MKSKFSSKNDPYLYDDADVLINKLGIKEEKQLNKAESTIVARNLIDVDIVTKTNKHDFKQLKSIHNHLFSDIYDWAGEPRSIPIVKGESILGGDTVRYSYPDNIEKDAESIIKKMNSVKWSELPIDEKVFEFSKHISALWQVHPFREGNTRTVMTFASQFAEAHGFKLDKELFAENALYLRNSLVKASDGEYSDYQYLVRIMKDSIQKGQELTKSLDKVAVKNNEVKIIECYRDEFPDIKNISKRGIKLLSQLNDINGHPVSLAEIKNLYKTKGKALEKEGFGNNPELEKEFGMLKDILKEIDKCSQKGTQKDSLQKGKDLGIEFEL